MWENNPMFGYMYPYLNKHALTYQLIIEVQNLDEYALFNGHQLHVSTYRSSPCDGIQSLLWDQSA